MHSRAIAATLSGSWRTDPPSFSLSERTFERIVPLLIESGAGSLAWWRLSHSNFKDSESVAELENTYRSQRLLAKVNVQRLETIIRALQDDGINPLLVKGWSLARLYPELALRPIGDVDLFLHPDEYALADSLVRSLNSKIPVDLHAISHARKNTTQLDGATLEELNARCQRVPLGDVTVRILAPEDQLRLVCLHFLRHGAWRPLWLCDIAVALETRPTDFDWKLVLGKNPQADWIACALGAAHQLLGARVEDTPAATRSQNLPRWLIPTILARWENPNPRLYDYPEPISSAWRSPSKLARAPIQRWRDPIRATVRMGGAFDESPRFFYQLTDFLSRGTRFLNRKHQVMDRAE